MREKLFVSVLLCALIVTLVTRGIFSLGHQITKNSVQQNKHTSQEMKISGKILFRKFNNLYMYDFSQKKEIQLTKVNSVFDMDEWSYANGYVFTIQNDSVKRLSLKDKTEVSVNITSAFPDEKSLVNENDYLIRIFPSHDAKKAVIIIGSYGAPSVPQKGFDNSLYYVDFTTKIVKYISDGMNFVQWSQSDDTLLLEDILQDSSHAISLFQPATLAVTHLHIAPVGPIALSVRDRVGWFEKEQYTYEKTSTFIAEPDGIQLVTNTLDNFIGSKRYPSDKQILHFRQFPIIARDFNSIEKFVPVTDHDGFLVQIDAGKNDIYYTDGNPWGTFKKITPNGPYDYSLGDINNKTDKIIALKVGLKNASLVLLDEGNYSQTVAGIDAKDFYEKELTTVPFPAALETQNAFLNDSIFSPDGKFIIIPEIENAGRNSQSTRYKVLQVSTGVAENLPADIQDHILWVD